MRAGEVDASDVTGGGGQVEGRVAGTNYESQSGTLGGIATSA